MSEKEKCSICGISRDVDNLTITALDPEGQPSEYCCVMCLLKYYHRVRNIGIRRASI